MSTVIRLVAGLGNPGPRHVADRHNAGFWLVDELARRAGVGFLNEAKFFAEACEITLSGCRLRLIKPQTYMNASGQALGAVARFFKIEPAAILVVHDEIDIPAGELRVKQGGGHGGHNGLRDIVSHLGSADFVRLRIGVGHPGHKDQVHGHVLKAPSRDEEQTIRSCIDKAIEHIPGIVNGNLAQVMNELHRRTKRTKSDEEENADAE